MTAIDPKEFRRVLGCLPTGVTVLAGLAGDRRPVGMAANAITSVSLDPPMILVCPALTSTTWPVIRGSGRFCASVMASHHAEACAQFAAPETERFKGVAWHERESGPALDGAVAWIDCSINAEHAAGDHTIVVADVLALETAGDADPLVFFRGRFGTFAPALLERAVA